ncbi:hypothetical protein K435DRAFT_877642 [Dendrothele bispora CBS 962.96]|uniref:DUF4219 domain-containing protein n=1 Tax=Dendrothele bispora (strain CBS 962.96) TaxID=1314807 RepID=A0A4S8KPR3_DENBC|nr:hypothetical protein K435DRAFT_877642 [Dendrothele bispora CBS 962.96]
MSDSTSSDTRKKVPTLVGDSNYEEWRLKAKAFLITQKLWKSVSPDETIPTNHQARQKWEERDETAFGELFLLVNDEIQGMIADLPQESGRAIWQFLATKYAIQNTPISRQSLRTAFYSLSHDPTLPVDTFISQVKRIATQIKRIGHPYKDDEISDKIKLPVPGENQK